MSTVNEKMTALASQVRELSGTTEYKTIDDMQLDVQDANGVISSQKSLIEQIKEAVANLPDALPDTDEKGSADLVIDGANVTAPAGYYPNGAEVSVKTTTAAFPVFDVSADEEESEIWLRAYNNQQEGYVGAASLFTDAFVKLTIDGSTAIMSCGDASIERTVDVGGGASIDTCTVTIMSRIGGYLHCYGATCYSDGKVNAIVDGQNVGNGTQATNITLKNVVCGSVLYVKTNGAIIPAYSVTNNSEVYAFDTNGSWVVKVTASPNVSETITLWDDD